MSSNKLPSICLKKATSTNDVALDYIVQKCPELFAVFAHEQTQGRGQKGNLWDSDANKNITFSIVVYPNFLPLSHFFLLSEITALMLLDFLNSYGICAQIKWPNDILVEKKKICGILIEQSITSQTLNHSIIGIGLNLNQLNFGSLQHKATSLSLLTQKTYNPTKLFSEMHQLFAVYYKNLEELINKQQVEQIEIEYKNKLLGYHTWHQYRIVDGNFIITAQIIEISTQGMLTLRTKENETKSFYFKEIELLLF